MKIGALEIDDKDVMIAAGALGLVIFFGHDAAKKIAKQVENAKQPLGMLPDFQTMKTIVADELVDD